MKVERFSCGCLSMYHLANHTYTCITSYDPKIFFDSIYSCINVFVVRMTLSSTKLCTGMCEMRSVEVSAPSEDVRKWLVDALLLSLLSTTGPEWLFF